MHRMAPTWAHSLMVTGEYRDAKAVIAIAQKREIGKARRRVLWPFLCRRAQKITIDRLSPAKREHGGVAAWPNSVANPRKEPAPMAIRLKRRERKWFFVRKEKTKEMIGVRKKLMIIRSNTICNPKP